MMIGFVRIETPPSNDDYIIIKNVDVVKPRSMRDVKQTVVNEDEKKDEDKRRGSKSNLGKAKMQGDDDELNLKVVYKENLDEEDCITCKGEKD